MTEDRADEIVNILTGYKHEAKENRAAGMNPRDEKWRQNLDLYYGRYDFSDKADWQSKEVMPEVSSYVDRFAAAMKEALVATPSSFYDVVDPADQERDLASAIKRATDVWLTSAGRNQTGTVLDFSAVFEEQMKLGSLMTTCSTVLWKEDVPGGRVAVETVDPRSVWLDHTYRNMYRIRSIELDRYELHKMLKATDSGKNPIYNLEELDRMSLDYSEDQRVAREELTGTGSETPSTRNPITVDEYIATVVSNDGKVLAENALMVVANDKYLLRGPEPNPYLHGVDWLVTAPLVSAPLSVYGRTYMEDFGNVAQVFTKLTNLLIDAAAAGAMNAFVAVPAMLIDPGQLAGGIGPNKRFDLEDGYRAEDFMKAIELGDLSSQAFQFWQSIKNELTEGAAMNEIGLGQFAPNARTSATEVAATQQSSSAIIRSIANTVEVRYLNPTLDLMWKTGLQKSKPNDKRLIQAVGEEMWITMTSMKREFIKRPYTFRAQGISMLIQKSQMLQSLMQLSQIIAGNPQLLQAFMARVDVNRFLDLLFYLSNIDISKLTTTAREQMIGQVLNPLNAAAQGAQGEAGPGMQAEMGDMVQRMGIGRQM